MTFQTQSILMRFFFSIESLREKLGKKVYESGILYMKMDEYESAEMSFQRTIDLYYDTEIFNKAIQGKILALAKNGELDNAKSILLENIKGLKEEGLYIKTKADIEKIQRKLTKSLK